MRFNRIVLLALLLGVVACSTDIPRLTRYRDRIWLLVEKADRFAANLNDLVVNRSSYPTYQAVQIAEDVSSALGYLHEELRGMAVPDPAREGHEKLDEAFAILAKAAAATVDYAASVNDPAIRGQAEAQLRGYSDTRGVAVARLERAFETAGLVARPVPQPIPKPGLAPPVDAYFRIE